MPNRWFLVPRTTRTRADESTGYVPKYSERVDGYAGQVYDVPSSWDLPVSGWQYAVRFYAPTDTLDAIAQNDDSLSIPDGEITRRDVEELLSAAVGYDQPLSDWETQFAEDVQ